MKARFELLSKFYIVVDNSSTIFKLLIVLLICMHVIVDSKEKKLIVEKLFLCVLKINFKTAKTSSTCLLRSGAAMWGGSSKLLSPTKIFKTTKTSSRNSVKLLK